MNEISTVRQEVQPQQLAGPTQTSSPVLLGQYPKSQSEVEQAKAEIARLNKPASATWIAQRIVTFLTGHYYVPEMANHAATSVGKDWARELNGLPEWAIEDALAFWISRKNTKRGKKPLPGDISERAHAIAAILTVGQKLIGFYEQYGDNPPAFLTK